MKKILLSAIIVLMATQSYSQANSDSLYLEKVKTLDSTIKTLYAVISGEAGEKRNWDLFRYLFKDEAKLIPSGKNKEGEINCRYMKPEDYIQQSGAWLEENGFHEIEMNRETQTFGNITQVFSAYESYRSKKDAAPFMRGTNSIQLLNDGLRWWVVNIFWVQESEDNQLPEFASKADTEGVQKACMNYLEGFYEGDTSKIISSLRPNLTKFGYWKNKTTGKYEAEGYMTFEQAVKYSSGVLKKKEFAKADAPKKVEILDIENNTASAKVTAWWGIDYILLSREDDKWMIEQVLWEGPLKE